MQEDTVYILVEGDRIRIRGLEYNSGCLLTQRANLRKWVMDIHDGVRWVRDCYINLPNDATVEDAVTAFGFSKDYLSGV